jgi:hypothetical protein
MAGSPVEQATDRLQVAADRFAAAWAVHAAAVAHRERAVARATRRLAAARGILPPGRVVGAGQRRRVHTVADALDAARAVRAVPAIEAARRSLDAISAAEHARVRATATELDAAAWQLRSFGAAGRSIVDAALEEGAVGGNGPP